MTTTSHILKIAIATAAASTLLVACSEDQATTSNTSETTTSAAQESTSAAVDAEVASATQFDTGDYFTKYRVEYGEADSLEAGILVESTALANAAVNPFELDRELNTGLTADHILSTSHMSRFLTSNYVDLVDESTLQSGYFYAAGNEDDSKRMSMVIIRFDSADTAKDMAYKWAVMDQAQGARVDENDELRPGTPTDFEGLPVSYATVVQQAEGVEGVRLHTFSAHNEFVLVTFNKTAKGTLQEQKDLASEYLTKQVPLLDGVQTHKTEAGAGMLPGWTKMDPTGILRYAVNPPMGEDIRFLPATYTPRGYATTQAEPEESLRLAELAGIERIAQNDTMVAQARNEEGAQMYKSGFLTMYQDRDFKEYEEPQGLPDTTCMSKDMPEGTYFECIMKFEDKVAVGTDLVVNFGEDATDTATAQTALSQKMAAQYAIFQDAKSNPQGTKSPYQAQD